MMLAACLLAALAAAAAAPATYDQRQDGELNIRADLQNVVLVIAMPQKMSLPSSIFDGLIKSSKGSEIQERADIHAMEAFVEPSTPYHVEIGSDRSADGDGRAVQVVIAGRRRLEVEPQAADGDEYKLLGAQEQCGPDGERDPVTLTCRNRQPPADPVPQSDDAFPLPDDAVPQPDDAVQALAAQPSPEVVSATA